MTKRQLWRIALAILGFICLGTIIWFCIYGIPQPSPNKPMSRHDYQSVVKKNTRAPSKHKHYVSGQSFVHPVTIIYTNRMMIDNKMPKKDVAYDKAAAIGSARHYINDTENRNEYHAYTTSPHITISPIHFGLNSNIYVRATEVNAVFIRRSPINHE